MLKKALIYLGLGPDEEYEQYDSMTMSGPAAVPDPEPVPEPTGPRPVEQAAPATRPAPAAQSRPGSATVRAVPANPTGGTGTVRVVPATPSSEPPRATRPAPQPTSPETGSAIRIVESTSTKPHAISPTSFNDAANIGDRFKSGQPVIVNLQGVDRDLRRRLVDFASGVCFALDGKMDRVADQVYLLTPADVEVSDDDTRRALD